MCHWEERIESHQHSPMPSFYWWENSSPSWRTVCLSPHNEWVVEPEQEYILAQDMLLMFSPGLIPPIELCLITFIHILPTESPALYLPHNRGLLPLPNTCTLEVGRQVLWLTKTLPGNALPRIQHPHLTTSCPLSSARFSFQLSLIALGRSKTAETTADKNWFSVLVKWFQLGDSITKRWDSQNDHPSVGILLVGLSGTWQMCLKRCLQLP